MRNHAGGLLCVRNFTNFIPYFQFLNSRLKLKKDYSPICIMCNVTKANFSQYLAIIQKELTTATFVAIDAEFSALLSDNEFKSSLFDSGDERYLKLKACTQQVIIMEMGLSIFTYDRDTHSFNSSVYNFYVFPRPFGSIDSRFLFQASSVEFLCNNSFDFNKVMYEGIPYLNMKQEALLRQEIQNGSLFKHLERNVSIDNERILQRECSKIADWVSSSIVGDDIHLKVYWIGADANLMNFILHQEIRRRFQNLWTYHASDEQIKVVRITESQHKDLFRKGVSKDLEDAAVNSLIGFSNIIKLLAAFKKPIVGHNLILDLLIVHNQFHLPLPTSGIRAGGDEDNWPENEICNAHSKVCNRPIQPFVLELSNCPVLAVGCKIYQYQGHLTVYKDSPTNVYLFNNSSSFIAFPETYSEFKQSMCAFLPQIYDTKFLSFELKKLLKNEEVWAVSTLKDLYEFFKTGRGKSLVLYSPKVTFAENLNDSSMKYHEAGWDSYYTGFCFIKIANMFAVYKESKSFRTSRMLTCTEIFNAVKSMRGRVNLIRANISNLNLEGDDPVSNRPQLLYVAPTKRSRPVDLSKITELFARYGSVDVKAYSSGSALVAVSTHGWYAHLTSCHKFSGAQFKITAVKMTDESRKHTVSLEQLRVSPSSFG